MNITKIKLLNDETALVKYQVDNETSVEKREFAGKEKVTTEFKTAFLNTKHTFVEYFAKLKNDIDRIKTLEVDFEYKNNTLKNASYKVVYSPSNEMNTSVNITTPKLPIWDDKAKKGVFYVSGKDIEIIDKARELAERYINGDTRTKQQNCAKVDENGNITLDFNNSI